MNPRTEETFFEDISQDLVHEYAMLLSTEFNSYRNENIGVRMRKIIELDARAKSAFVGSNRKNKQFKALSNIFLLYALLSSFIVFASLYILEESFASEIGKELIGISSAITLISISFVLLIRYWLQKMNQMYNSETQSLRVYNEQFKALDLWNRYEKFANRNATETEENYSYGSAAIRRLDKTNELSREEVNTLRELLMLRNLITHGAEVRMADVQMESIIENAERVLSKLQQEERKRRIDKTQAKLNRTK